MSAVALPDLNALPADALRALILTQHEQLLAKRTQGTIDVYFEGNSIIRRWGATDYTQFLENWRANFFGWNAADFGWGGDTTANILWRVRHGELTGVHPKVIVLLAGTYSSISETSSPNLRNSPWHCGHTVSFGSCLRVCRGR